jgi:hypothetical protein
MSRRSLYFNPDGEPISLWEMATLLEDDYGRRVTDTRILTKDGSIRISTAFMAIDLDPLSDVPVLWETMVFGGPCSGAQHRYASREAAIAGHEEVLSELMAVLSNHGINVITTDTLAGKLGKSGTEEYDALVASLESTTDISASGDSLDEASDPKGHETGTEGETSC